MEGSVAAEDLGAPESWESPDLEESMSRLMLRGLKKGDAPLLSRESSLGDLSDAPSSSLGGGRGGEKVSPEEAFDQVDQFLLEALQNPRERLSVLRLEQDVEKFIRDPMQQQMEFQQLPTSYLRLAAHRVAQHYSLQSMVLLDNSLPDGSGSRIIVRKTSECKLPSIRLADIPFSLAPEDTAALKIAIKQRPQKQSHLSNSLSSKSLKANSSKSVEERKEEYNRARARIFNSASFGGSASGNPDGEARLQDAPKCASLGVPNAEERISVNSGRSTIESSTSSSKPARTRTDKEPSGWYKPNSRVAIFRDRDIDRKDPDYDRNYDRYTQRFDPGFGYNGGAYTMQPLYAPAVNYNTEFPQLMPNHMPQISTEHRPRHFPQHLPGSWSAPSAPGTVGYGHPETLIPPFSPNHIGARSASTIYLHSQYPGQHPGMNYTHPHEHVQPYTQSHQRQSDASFGFARPR